VAGFLLGEATRRERRGREGTRQAGAVALEARLGQPRGEPPPGGRTGTRHQLTMPSTAVRHCMGSLAALA
jgi:hypothetical protein